MSSVTRFLRQIPVSTTYYTVTAANTQALQSTFYAMTPSIAGGNYPGSVAAIDAGTASVLSNANITIATNVYLLRDMGKTIKATVSGQTVPNFFREVQVLNPSTYASTFGVAGPDYNNVSAYFTFYVPVAMPGFSSGLAPVAMTPVAGGQA
jgi:hypothetical protein